LIIGFRVFVVAWRWFHLYSLKDWQLCAAGLDKYPFYVVSGPFH